MKKNGDIILIDDSEIELKLSQKAMEKARLQHKIISFTKAKAAFDYISRDHHSVFLIISDLEMPDMSGMELLEKINGDHELKMRAIPFIFLSNSGKQKDIERAYSLAAQGYFLKPLKLQSLEEIFKDIVIYWNYAQIPRE